MKKLAHILLLMLSYTITVAQEIVTPPQGYGQISGWVTVPSESGGYRTEDGVVVEAYTAKDTLYTMTASGVFKFAEIEAGTVTLKFSHISYKTVEKTIQLKAGEKIELSSIRLTQENTALDAAKVTEEIPILKISGDTLIYNGAAVQTLEGDVALNILEQLPGVEASEHGVSVLGKNVELTYVDGKLLFGENTMAALLNLPANDVLKVRTYEENKKGDRLKKRQVLDIETKSKLVQAISGHALASFGTDLDKKKIKSPYRYGIGATTNFFSEKFLFSANAFSNNLNRKSNRINDILNISNPGSNYNETIYVDTEIEKVWHPKWVENDYSTMRLHVQYTYDDNYTHAETITQKDYFQNSEYDFRQYADTSANTGTSRYHQARINFYTPLKKGQSLSFMHNMRFAEDESDSYRGYSNRLDNLEAVGGRTSAVDKRNSFTMTDRLTIYPSIRHLHIEVNFDISNSNGSGFREDKELSGTTVKTLNSTSDGLSRIADAAIHYHIPTNDENLNEGFDFGYYFTWEKSKRLQTTLNTIESVLPVIDSVNTFDYTNNYNKHTFDVSYRLNLKKWMLQFSSGILSYGINRDERFPDEEVYDKRFTSVIPRFSCTYMGGALKSFQFQCLTTSSIPSVEQLREQLDDSNPYMLVAGNSQLKQTYTYRIISSYNSIFGKKNHSIMLGLDARLSNNMIARKQTFFTTSTRLEEWDYTAPAQSTLTTYENVNNACSVTARIDVTSPLRKIRSTLTYGGTFDFESTPYFTNETLVRTVSYAPGIKVLLKANISKYFRGDLSSSTSYIHSINSMGVTDNIIRQGASVNGGLQNIFNHLYLKGSYNFSYYKRFGKNAYDYNNQVLNLALGCKLLKNNLDLSISAYDILNRNSGFKTQMYSDYINNSWTMSFGRYITFNIAYKFYRSKSKINRSGLNDGRTSSSSTIVF